MPVILNFLFVISHGLGQLTRDILRVVILSNSILDLAYCAARQINFETYVEYVYRRTGSCKKNYDSGKRAEYINYVFT
jgi:hypothetical protein